MRKKFSAQDIFDELSKNRLSDSKAINIPRKSLLKKVANKKVTPATRKFLNKLNSERFQDFDKGDWLMYFQMKYREANGIGYQIRGNQMYIKHHSIIKSLMKNYTPNDIRSMIDFLFTSNQDIFDKGQITVFHLSSGFLPTVFQNTQLWIIGKYKPKSQTYKDRIKKSQRNREWTKDKSNSTKIEL